MRTLSKSRNHFHGTHKGHEIEIERERPPVDSFGERHFYIRVWSIKTGEHGYDGFSPAGVTTLAEAKREALYGAHLRARPALSQHGEPKPSGEAGAVSVYLPCFTCDGTGEHPDEPEEFCPTCAGDGVEPYMTDEDDEP